MSESISVSSLTKYYGKFLAVDQIDFSVRKGEVFGFLGPNGAGKTTTVRMLTGLLEPTQGTILINGYDILQRPYEAKKQFGIVPEESNIYTELSAWNNLNFAGKLYRVPKEERYHRARKLLEIFGLWEKRNIKGQFFSKGMRRRLTIAMALIHKPVILFLDEPTTGLDVQSARAIKNIILEMNDKGATVFLTTHQMEEANQICERVAIINHGRIAAIDTPEHLKGTYQSVQSIAVAFSRTALEYMEDLGNLPEVSKIVKQGDKIRLYTSDPSALLPKIMSYAESKRLKVISLRTLGPSLEDVFLRITGQEVGEANRNETPKVSERKRGIKRESEG